MLPKLLNQIPPDQDIASVTAAAIVTRKCHGAIGARGAASIIPPRNNAKPSTPDTPGSHRAQRGASVGRSGDS